MLTGNKKTKTAADDDTAEKILYKRVAS